MQNIAGRGQRQNVVLIGKTKFPSSLSLFSRLSVASQLLLSGNILVNFLLSVEGMI